MSVFNFRDFTKWHDNWRGRNCNFSFSSVSKIQVCKNQRNENLRFIIVTFLSLRFWKYKFVLFDGTKIAVSKIVIFLCLCSDNVNSLSERNWSKRNCDFLSEYWKVQAFSRMETPNFSKLKLTLVSVKPSCLEVVRTLQFLLSIVTLSVLLWLT